LKTFLTLEKDLVELKEFYQSFKNENDQNVKIEITEIVKVLKNKVKNVRVQTLLSGEADNNDCFLEIHAGAGGTESQDWAEMLSRMYARWIEKKNFKKSLIYLSDGEEAGIKSVSIKVEGDNAYGLLKNESGIHRLVRISPFDSQKRRHTSFASVWVYPEVANSIKINIEAKDIRVDTYRASGAGGQHVNKTDSAIRITHLPSSIVVQCQSQRSQHQNRATAYKMLESRLYELELRKQDKKNQEIENLKKEIGWGNQIRSYVMQPYQMVKDLRTNQETTDVSKVLDGEIDSFIFSALAKKKSSR
tara:strand:+ start:6941 stop:7852 length:912 start_codon:yes stop_codon:yes gene_type:complete